MANIAEAEAVWIGSFGTIYKVPSEATAGSVAVVEHVLGPRQLGSPLHRHSREDEISHVLEGELAVQQGDRIEIARVGETIQIPVKIHRHKAGEPLGLVINRVVFRG